MSSTNGGANQSTSGPIVRINPDEVHFNDPDFIEPLYPGAKRKTNKSVMTGRRTGSKCFLSSAYIIKQKK